LHKSSSTEFQGSPVTSGNRFCNRDEGRYEKVQETLHFYRDHLEEIYQFLSKQARVTYLLWILAVTFGMAVLLAGIGLLIAGKLGGGLIMTINTALVYYIERVFRRREDHYSSLATSKHAYLEYCKNLSLAIQSIDAIKDSTEREKYFTQLVNILIIKLQTHSEQSSVGRPEKKPCQKEGEEANSEHGEVNIASILRKRPGSRRSASGVR